jgi:hypothetical protein
VLLSAPLHASVTSHDLLNVPVQFADKIGFPKKYLRKKGKRNDGTQRNKKGWEGKC